MTRGDTVGLIDKELKQKHAAEERLLRFAEFVREQKAKGSPGMSRACLLSEGYRDFYGQVVFAYGMHRSLWILPAGENPKVLLFSKQEEAQAYAKKLQKILRDNGYPFSKARAEQVAVRTSKNHPYSRLFLPTHSFEPEDRFIILMRIK